MRKVSVIMGIYNCADSLSEAIDSILNQTFEDWELIMCDDGSTDETYDIAKFFSEKYPDKIVLLRNNRNMRLAATLNTCLSVSEGEYVARMDADDVNMPTRFEKEVKYLDFHPDVHCVGCNMIMYDEHGETGIRSNPPEVKKETLLKVSPFSHPTVMIRSSVLKQLGGYTVSNETQRAEDVDLWFRFFAAGYKGYVIQEPLYRYKEEQTDFKKRSVKAAIGTSKVYLRGYKLLGFPKYKYIYALKPIVSAILPNWLMYRYRKHQNSLMKQAYESTVHLYADL